MNFIFTKLNLFGHTRTRSARSTHNLRVFNPKLMQYAHQFSSFLRAVNDRLSTRQCDDVHIIDPIKLCCLFRLPAKTSRSQIHFKILQQILDTRFLARPNIFPRDAFMQTTHIKYAFDAKGLNSFLLPNEKPLTGKNLEIVCSFRDGTYKM